MRRQRRYIGAFHRYNQRLRNLCSDIFHSSRFLFTGHKSLHVGLIRIDAVEVENADNQSVRNNVLSSDMDVHFSVFPPKKGQ